MVFEGRGPLIQPARKLSSLVSPVGPRRPRPPFQCQCQSPSCLRQVGYGVPVLTENDLLVLHDVPAEDKVGAARLAGRLVEGGATCARTEAGKVLH